jgi:hypothetical protein
VEGKPQRVHLERAAARGHKAAIAALARVPEVPQEGEYLWEYFLELSLGRGAGPMGSSSLSYRDVEAWCRLMDRRLAPHEVQAVLLIDAAIRDPGELEEDE